MTAEEQSVLRAQALADPACADAIARRDLDELAARLSVGRTCGNDREIGYGTILEELGLEAGNQLIDFIKGNPALRHVVPLLEQGRLRIGSAVVQSALQSFVAAGAVSQANADRLCALGKAPSPLTREEVRDAIFNPDGSEK